MQRFVSGIYKEEAPKPQPSVQTIIDNAIAAKQNRKRRRAPRQNPSPNYPYKSERTEAERLATLRMLGEKDDD